jgi:DNA-binding NarL/FixJ family response regulator
MMGGTRSEVVQPLLAGTGIHYYPFPGEVVGHPSVLAGSTDAIVESARQMAAMNEVDGLDLLAYRFQGDAPDLIRRVGREVAPKPVVVTGSIDRPKRIAAVIKAGVAGFTAGTAALNGIFPARSSALSDQLAYLVPPSILSLSRATLAR